MQYKHRWMTSLATLLCGMLACQQAQGDGCVIDRVGRYVPEQEQLAFIKWHDGQQRLYVATRTEPTDQPTLWIVPIRAQPQHAQAEPVETTPQVIYYRPFVERALQRIDAALTQTQALDGSI